MFILKTKKLYRKTVDIYFLNFQATNEEQLTTALNKALELGYRHIDTAYIYQNESVIGKVLKEWFSSGKLKRSDLFITTKLPSQAVQADLVETFLKKSLTALELDYVDLYLIHTPILRRKDDSTGDFVTCETDHIAVWKVKLYLFLLCFETYQYFIVVV